MSVSSDAMLFYGLTWDEDEIGDRINDIYDYDHRKYELAVGYFCCDEYPLPYVCVCGTYHNANRGEVHTLPTDLMNLTAEQKKDYAERLKKFCEENKLPYRKPEWILVSWMG